MKSSRFTLYLSLTWLLTLGLAYIIGWWRGIQSVTHVAANAANSSAGIIMAVLAAIAIVTAVAAYRMRGYVDRHNLT